jgi:hypothetical protein
MGKHALCKYDTILDVNSLMLSRHQYFDEISKQTFKSANRKSSNSWAPSAYRKSANPKIS